MLSCLIKLTWIGSVVCLQMQRNRSIKQETRRGWEFLSSVTKSRSSWSTILNVSTNFEIDSLSGVSGNTWKPLKCDKRTNSGWTWPFLLSPPTPLKKENKQENRLCLGPRQYIWHSMKNIKLQHQGCVGLSMFYLIHVCSHQMARDKYFPWSGRYAWVPYFDFSTSAFCSKQTRASSLSKVYFLILSQSLAKIAIWNPFMTSCNCC